MNHPTPGDYDDALHARQYYLAGQIRLLTPVVREDAERVKTFIAGLKNRQAALKELRAQYRALKELRAEHKKRISQVQQPERNPVDATSVNHST